MVEKNPYENGVDIPDFIETKSEGIDMSAFKISDEELNSNSRSFDFDSVDEYEEEEEETPKRKLSAKGIMAIGGGLLVLMLIVSLVCLVYGVNQHSKYTKALTEAENLQTQLSDKNNTIVDLQNQITAIKAEIEANKSPEVSDDSQGVPSSGTYTVKSDKGLNVRAGAGSTSFANVNDVSSIKEKLNINDNVITMNYGTDFKVYETKEVSGNTWARIVSGKEVWVCIKLDGDSLASKN